MKKIDPRIKLEWWLSISILAMLMPTWQSAVIPVAVLIFTWMITKQKFGWIRLLIRTSPILLMILFTTVFVTGSEERAALMCMRFWVMMGATALMLQHTSHVDLTDGIRQAAPSGLSVLKRPVEMFAFLFGLSIMTIPAASSEWERLKEVQAACGVDISAGNKVTQVKSGLAMTQPLLLRFLDKIKNYGIAMLLYGYNPAEYRTVYKKLQFSNRDRYLAVFILIYTIAITAIAFTLK